MDKDQKVNIGYIENSSKIGGGNRSMETLLRGLRGSEFASYFVCPSSGPMVKLIRSLGVPIEIHKLYQPSWSHPIKTYHHWRIWSRFITSNKLSLIHANGLHSGRSVVLAAYTCQVPLICHIRFLSDTETCRWMFRRLPKPTGFIFTSNAIRNEMSPILKEVCSEARQWVIYNGVDIRTFTPALTSNELPRIGIIGNLQRIKGHEDFLKMAALLTNAGRELQYEIIGGETQEQGRLKALEAYTEHLGITKHVRFYGHVDQVADLIKQLDLVICTSYFESFGRCLIEGMACGKPVVATNVGGIPEVVEDQTTGILVPPHNPSALAEAVSKLLDDEKMRNIMGKNGRKRVQQMFSMEAYTAGVLNIYREVLNL